MARRILGFSYVTAYYMFDGVTFGDDISPAHCSLLRDLFEDAQSMLEAEVPPPLHPLTPLLHAPHRTPPAPLLVTSMQAGLAKRQNGRVGPRASYIIFSEELGGALRAREWDGCRWSACPS